MSYPRFVYRVPGPHQMAGGTYDHALVHDDDETLEKLAEGWHRTLPEAINPLTLNDLGYKLADIDDAPPTRSELEAKANELGLKFHHKIGDAKLADLIKKALEA